MTISSTTSSPTRQRLMIAARIAVIVIIAGFIVYAVVNNWSGVEKAWLGLAWQSVALSLIAAVAAMVANTLAWREAAADLGHRVEVPTAANICLVGGLAKYVPGSVWAYFLQMELGRRAGLPRAVAFLTSLVATGLGIATALVVGLVGVPYLLDAAQTADAANAGAIRSALWIMVVLLPIALLCAVPAMLTRLIQLFLRLVKRPPLADPLTWPGVLRVMGFSALGWTFFGLHLWLLANAQGAPGIGGLLACVGAMAIAMSIGTFAFFAPSGIGVRDAVLVAVLTPLVGGAPAAIGIAVFSRLILTVADLLSAGIAALWSSKLYRRPVVEISE